MKNRAKPTARELLSVEIRAILNEHPDNDNYGVNRMVTALAQKGVRVSRRTVYRTMSEMGIIHRRRTPRGITKATTEIQDRENLIKRNFKAEKSLQKLLSDITEIQCYDGKLYLSADVAQEDVPRCAACGGIVRPDVVLYGEGLDNDVINGAVKAIREADMMIVGGTSLVVYPAAGLINYYKGDKLVLINRDATSYDNKADLIIHDSIGEVFSQMK